MPSGSLFLSCTNIIFNCSTVDLAKGWPNAVLTIGQIGGMATDSKGQIHILHRADRVWGHEWVLVKRDIHLLYFNYFSSGLLIIATFSKETKLSVRIRSLCSMWTGISSNNGAPTGKILVKRYAWIFNFFFFRFYLPHGLSIDTNDNLWLTDVALHQVFPHSPLIYADF